jgi:hypothetical protein
VVSPAYGATEAGLRAVRDARKAEREPVLADMACRLRLREIETGL